MDIPSLHEVHQLMEGNTAFSTERYYTHVDVKIINDLKAAVDDLEMRLKAAEQKLHEMELKFWVMEGDGR